jgi:hypothetical protein
MVGSDMPITTQPAGKNRRRQQQQQHNKHGEGGCAGRGNAAPGTWSAATCQSPRSLQQQTEE